MFWANDPSTATPLSADNLSRAERFLTATAGSNGDFYVTIPNSAGLTSGDVVQITFPAATDGASNARLSIDGGSTYKNIFFSAQVIASYVQSQKLTLVYDGTQWKITTLIYSTMSVESTVATATADKGTYEGFLPIGGVLELVMTNGNTAASPTITIGGVQHSIASMPTVAKLASSTNQVYRLKKTAPTTLTFIQYPDYVCEYGTSGDWAYQRYASGMSETYATTQVSLTNTATYGTGGLYIHNGTVTVPTGIFNATPKFAAAAYSAASTSAGSTFGYPVSSTSIGVQIIRNSTSSASPTVTILAIGTWK